MYVALKESGSGGDKNGIKSAFYDAEKTQTNLIFNGKI